MLFRGQTIVLKKVRCEYSISWTRLSSTLCSCSLSLLQVLRDILKEVQGNMVPRSMLREWALHTFPNATDYWTFRKMFTIQLALIGLAEFMLHLNRLNPEMLQIAQVGNTKVQMYMSKKRTLLGSLSRTSGIRLTG